MIGTLSPVMLPITGDINNIFYYVIYDGLNSLQVRDNFGIKIFDIGTCTITIANHFFIFKDKLCTLLSLSILLIKHVCVLILQWSRFFIEFLELILLIGLSYSSNNLTIFMTIYIEVKIFSQFCLLHEMLHNLGVQLLYFIFLFS
jgi:hypothetical protein